MIMATETTLSAATEATEAAAETAPAETAAAETTEAAENPTVTETAPETQEPEPADPLKDLGALENDAEAQARALMDMGLTEETDAGQRPEGHDIQNATTAQWYTAEELGNTPLDQIDAARLPEGARDYLPVVKRNMDIARQTIMELQQQNAALMQQLQANAPAPAPAVKPDFKSMAEQAAKIAKERLGLDEDDDLELTYEPEHAAAFHMAMREVADGMMQNAAAPSNVVDMGAAREWDAYVSQLTSRPDFAARDKWITDKLTQAGKNPNMLGEYIQQTRDFAGAKRVIDAWNRMYDEEQARISQAVKNQARPAQRPPVLEGASGTDAGGRRTLNLRAFGDMEANPEAQAQALMRLGLV